MYPLHSGSAWPARAVYLLARVLLVLWLYHCTVCTVLVPLVQWSGMASTGNVHFTSFCTRNCACISCTVVKHGQHGPCTYWPMFYRYCGCTIAQFVLCLYLVYSGLAWPARVMYVLPVFVLVTVRVPLVQWFSMASTGRVLIGPCFNSYCGCIIAQFVLCLCLIYSV